MLANVSGSLVTTTSQDGPLPCGDIAENIEAQASDGPYSMISTVGGHDRQQTDKKNHRDTAFTKPVRPPQRARVV